MWVGCDDEGGRVMEPFEFSWGCEEKPGGGRAHGFRVTETIITTRSQRPNTALSLSFYFPVDGDWRGNRWFRASGGSFADIIIFSRGAHAV